MTLNFSFIYRLPKSRLYTLQIFLLIPNHNQKRQLTFDPTKLYLIFLGNFLTVLKIIPKFLKIYFDGFDMLLMFLMMYGISTIEAPLIIEILFGGDPKGGDFFWILKIE